MATAVDLIGGFYKDDTLPWGAQDTVNWLPVMAEVAGTLTPKYLKTPPGLKPYIQVGAGPIRGIHDLEGGRFVVSGTVLYRIDSAGVGIPIGVIPGLGRVQMTHNQFQTGNQLLVENGQGGGGYVFTTSTGTFAKITDEGYPGSISSDYLDSYLLGVEPLGRFWFHSNLADATDYNTLDRYEAEASPDRIVGLAVSQFEVVVFGERTIEFFYNAGGTTGTFQNRRQTITRGCSSRHTIAKLDNTLFWLGDDGVVYRMNGYSAIPVSTGPMARAFANLNWAEAFAFTWEDEGFKVYYLTFPDGQTWGYDVVSGLWTRRESYGLDRWRLANTVKWGRNWYGGDFQNGRLWELNWEYVLEGVDEFISRRVSPVMSNNQSLIGINKAELIFDTGQGPETVPVPFPGQPPSPTISGTPPVAIRGVPYTFSFSITGGTPPVTAAIVDGALPLGLSMNSAGVISGTPEESGTFAVYVRATDAGGMWDEIAVQINVQSSLMALATTLYLFTGAPSNIQESTPIGISSSVSRSLSVSPNTLYIAAGIVGSPFIALRKKKADATGYDALPTPSTPPTTLVNSTAFSPDGKYFALLQGGATPRVMVYEIIAGVFTFRSQANMLAGGFAIAWNEDGTKIVASKEYAGATGSVAIFNVTLGILGTPRYGQSYTNGTTPISLMWRGNYIVSGSSNQLVVMLDNGSAATTVAINPDGLGLVNAGAVWSKDGNYIYTLRSNGQLRIYAFSGSSISNGVLAPSQPIGGGVDISINSNGTYVAVGASGGGLTHDGVQIYRVVGASLVREAIQPFTTESTVNGVRWTQDES